jgi:hypothetical protein
MHTADDLRAALAAHGTVKAAAAALGVDRSRFYRAGVVSGRRGAQPAEASALWGPPTVEACVELARTGRSASAIARELGVTTPTVTLRLRLARERGLL